MAYHTGLCVKLSLDDHVKRNLNSVWIDLRYQSFIGVHHWLVCAIHVMCNTVTINKKLLTPLPLQKKLKKNPTINHQMKYI